MISIQTKTLNFAISIENSGWRREIKLYIHGRRTWDPCYYKQYCMIAMELHHTAAATLLIESQKCGPDYDNLFSFACARGNKEIAKLLLHDVSTRAHNRALTNAVKHNDIRFMTFLLAQPGIDPSIGDNKLIKNAAQLGHCRMAKLLLTHPNVNPNVGSGKNHQPIIIAVDRGDIEMVRTLLEDSRVNPNISDFYLFYRASINRRITPMFKLLVLDHRFMPQRDVLRIACERDDNEIVTNTLEKFRFNVGISDYLNTRMGAAARQCFLDHIAEYYWVIKELLYQHAVIDLLPWLIY